MGRISRAAGRCQQRRGPDSGLLGDTPRQLARTPWRENARMPCDFDSGLPGDAAAELTTALRRPQSRLLRTPPASTGPGSRRPREHRAGGRAGVGREGRMAVEGNDLGRRRVEIVGVPKEIICGRRRAARRRPRALAPAGGTQSDARRPLRPRLRAAPKDN